jgi:hypothetical protein
VAVTADAGARSTKARYLSLFLSALTLGFFALAFVLLPLHFISDAKARAFFDWYTTARGLPGKIGSYLTPETLSRIFARLPIAAAVFGICGVTLALLMRSLARFLLDIPPEWTRIFDSLRQQFQGRAETALELAAVSSVFATGIVLRVWHLNRAVRYDEAWTYLNFASRPLLVGLSNYQAPNNHLLNTLLVHFSTRLFGDTIFALRFPALAAGCLVILACWFVTRSLYGPLAGILAAGCVAALPTFIEFSVNARGYALQWLFILALIGLATLLLENPSLNTGWLAFVLAAVAGIYSIPTTAIALAGVFLWMLTSTLAGGQAAKFQTLSKYLALAGLAISLLSILLYLPPLLDRGPGAVLAKEVVAWQQRDDFLQGFARMSQCAWVRWTQGVPSIALWILFAGLVVGLFFHRRICRHRVPMTIALCLAAAIFACVRQIFAFPRVWSYLLLSAVMTACAGLSPLLTYLVGRSRIRQVALASVLSLALAMFVGAAVIKQRVLFTSDEGGWIIDAGPIVDFVSTELRTGDYLVSNAIIKYELLRRSPKLYGSLAKSPGAARVVAVVVKRVSNTEFCGTEKALPLQAAQDVADPSALSPQIDLNAYTKPEVRAKFLTSTVFSLTRKPARTE